MPNFAAAPLARRTQITNFGSTSPLLGPGFPFRPRISISGPQRCRPGGLNLARAGFDGTAARSCCWAAPPRCSASPRLLLLGVLLRCSAPLLLLGVLLRGPQKKIPDEIYDPPTRPPPSLSVYMCVRGLGRLPAGHGIMGRRTAHNKRPERPNKDETAAPKSLTFQGGFVGTSNPSQRFFLEI